MVQRQMVQRQMSTGMLVGNIGRENALASEKRARAHEKGALRQEGGKIKPHRNRRACPDAVGVDKNHAEKLLPPLWRSRLLYGLSGANATGRGRQTDFFAIRRKRSHLAPAFPPAASRRDGGNGGRSKFLRARGPSQAHPEERRVNVGCALPAVFRNNAAKRRKRRLFCGGAQPGDDGFDRLPARRLTCLSYPRS